MTKQYRHREPLTAADLARIYDENPWPVVLKLLWEIHRLHSTIRRANQVRKMLTEGSRRPHLPGGIWEIFEGELDAEPCLTDPPTPRQQGKLYPGETDGRQRRRMRNGG